MREWSRNPRSLFSVRHLFFVATKPLPTQPCLGVSPVLLGRRLGDAQDLRRLGHRTTKKVPQLDQFGLAWRFLGELIQGLVNGQHFERIQGVWSRQVLQVRILVRNTAAPFATLLAAGPFDENSPHRLGRRGKEVATMVPMLIRDLAYQPQIGLV